MFDPADTVQRVGSMQLGRRWSTARHGLLEVTGAQALRATWPLRLRLIVECDDWAKPRVFELEFTSADTVADATPAGNAEALAEEAMVRIERYLDGDPVPGLSEAE